MENKINKNNKETNKEINRGVLSFFMLAFPTVLIVCLSMLTEKSWWIQILLAIFQFIMLKHFIDSYYEVS